MLEVTGVGTKIITVIWLRENCYSKVHTNGEKYSFCNFIQAQASYVYSYLFIIM